MHRWLTGVGVVLLGCAQRHPASSNPNPPRIVVVTEASGVDPGADQAAALVDDPVPGPAVAPGALRSPDAWLGGSALRTRVLVGSDGQNRVGVWVDPVAPVGGVVRAPMSVALVMDSSGSMRGEKLVQARRAASALLGELRVGDLVSLYTFADVATEVLPPTELTDRNGFALQHRLDAVRATGGTNLERGLVAALRSASATPASHPLRRVIVISDGRVTHGLSSPDALGAIAAREVGAGVQVTTIGVGLDYDEHTLAAISQQSAGRLYHLDDPSQMAAIVRDELRVLSDAVATDAVVEVTAAPGVTLLGVEGGVAETEPGRVRVRLGNLYGGRHHEVLVRVAAATDAAGAHPLAFARLTCREVSGARREHTETVSLAYAVTANARDLASDARVHAITATRDASAIQRRAVDQLNAGQATEADQQLAAAEQTLRNAATEPTTPAPAVANLLQQADEIQNVRTQASHAAAMPHASRRAALQTNRGAVSAMDPY